MDVSIPFEEEVFSPLCIKGNTEAEHPVTFEICAVGGASRARLRSMIHATSGLSDTGSWSREVQDSVIAAFHSGAAVFAEGVKAITGLTVPVALALKVGILTKIPPGLDRQSKLPIATGYEYAKVCGYWPILSFELAMAIARISGQSEVDPRFFGWLSTSLGMPGILPGTAEPAESAPGSNATAGSKAPTGNRRRSTSRRTRSSSVNAPARTE